MKKSIQLIRSCLVTLIFMCTVLFSTAQDTQYWTNQFGNKSSLLGGAVVGGVQENDMVVYNPASLVFIDDEAISVNANAYRVENIKIEDVLNRQLEFKNSNFATIPVLIGGMVPIKHPHWKIGYGIFSPVKFNFNATSHHEGMSDVWPDNISPGIETVIGDLKKVSNLSEFTATWGIARKVTEKFSLGLSHFFTFRSLNYSDHVIVHTEVNGVEQQPVSTLILTETKYYHQRLRLKLGANYNSYPLRLGMTVTSPSIGIFGKGSVAADVTASDLPIGDQFVSFFATDRQDDLKSKYKMPLAIAIGANYSFPISRVYFSAEYFFAIDRYTILQPEENDFFRSSNVQAIFGSEEFLKVQSGAQSVFNVGLGYEHDVRPDMTLHFSVRSDQTYKLPNDGSVHRINTEISSWDLYHFSLGTTRLIKKNSFTIGLLFSFGKNDKHEEQTILDGPDEDGGAVGSPYVTSARYTSFGLLLGYKFDLKNKE